jgi:hypothetical protein
LSSTELDFRQWPIVQFCQGKYPTKTKLLAIVETQDKLRRPAMQAACNAGGCNTGSLHCMHPAMQQSSITLFN